LVTGPLAAVVTRNMSPDKSSNKAYLICKTRISRWAGEVSLNYAKDALAGASVHNRSNTTSDLVMGLH